MSKWNFDFKESFSKYSSKTVFTPFTMLFVFTLVIFFYSLSFNLNLNVSNAFNYSYIISAVLIILASYFLSFFLLLGELNSKKAILIVFTILSFMATTYFGVRVVYELADTTFPLDPLRNLLFASSILFVNVILVSAKYLYRFALILLIVVVLSYFSIEINSYTAESNTIQEIVNSFSTVRYYARLGDFISFWSFLVLLSTVHNFVKELR